MITLVLITMLSVSYSQVPLDPSVGANGMIPFTTSSLPRSIETLRGFVPSQGNIYACGIRKTNKGDVGYITALDSAGNIDSTFGVVTLNFSNSTLDAGTSAYSIIKYDNTSIVATGRIKIRTNAFETDAVFGCWMALNGRPKLSTTLDLLPGSKCIIISGLLSPSITNTWIISEFPLQNRITIAFEYHLLQKTYFAVGRFRLDFFIPTLLGPLLFPVLPLVTPSSVCSGIARISPDNTIGVAWHRITDLSTNIDPFHIAATSLVTIIRPDDSFLTLTIDVSQLQPQPAGCVLSSIASDGKGTFWVAGFLQNSMGLTSGYRLSAVVFKFNSSGVRDMSFGNEKGAMVLQDSSWTTGGNITTTLTYSYFRLQALIQQGTSSVIARFFSDSGLRDASWNGGMLSGALPKVSSIFIDEQDRLFTGGESVPTLTPQRSDIASTSLIQGLVAFVGNCTLGGQNCSFNDLATVYNTPVLNVAFLSPVFSRTVVIPGLLHAIFRSNIVAKISLDPTAPFIQAGQMIFDEGSTISVTVNRPGTYIICKAGSIQGRPRLTVYAENSTDPCYRINSTEYTSTTISATVVVSCNSVLSTGAIVGIVIGCVVFVVVVVIASVLLAKHMIKVRDLKGNSDLKKDELKNLRI